MKIVKPGKVFSQNLEITIVNRDGGTMTEECTVEAKRQNGVLKARYRSEFPPATTENTVFERAVIHENGEVVFTKSFRSTDLQHDYFIFSYELTMKDGEDGGFTVCAE